MYVARSSLLLRFVIIGCAVVFIAGCKGTEWEGMFDDVLGLTSDGSQSDPNGNGADTSNGESEDAGERTASGTELIDYHGPVGLPTEGTFGLTCVLQVQVYGTDNRPLPNARLHIATYLATWKEEGPSWARVTGYNEVSGTYDHWYGNCDGQGQYELYKVFALGGADQQVGVVEVDYVLPSAPGLASVILDKKRVYFHVTDEDVGDEITKYVSLQE